LVHIWWFWSSKRGAPKLHLYLHYSSIEFWSLGVWLENWMELLEFSSRAMPNKP
jgi:hypothetical protein